MTDQQWALTAVFFFAFGLIVLGWALNMVDAAREIAERTNKVADEVEALAEQVGLRTRTDTRRRLRS